MSAEIVGGPSQRSPQVRPANVSNEYRISGENRVRLCRALLEIKHKDRDGLDGVARRFENLQPQVRKLECVSIRHRRKGIFPPRRAAQINRCATAVTQLQMPGNKVGMEVCQEDVANLQTESLRVRHVLFDIALWIDNGRSCASLISQQVGGMGQATQIVLFQNHAGYLF